MCVCVCLTIKIYLIFLSFSDTGRFREVCTSRSNGAQWSEGVYLELSASAAGTEMDVVSSQTNQLLALAAEILTLVYNQDFLLQLFKGWIEAGEHHAVYLESCEVKKNLVWACQGCL